MKSSWLLIVMLLNTVSLPSMAKRRIQPVYGVELKIARMMFRM